MRPLLAPLLLLLAGCSTLETIGIGDVPFIVYSGTIRNVWVLTPPPPREDGTPEGQAFGGLPQCVAAVDLPFSFVLDTVLLPLSVPMTLFR